MKKVKVRIYKDPNGKGEFINPTKKFLQKAAAGMQVGQDMMSLEDRIVEELKNNTTAEDIADILEAEYGVKYYEALNLVDDVINYVYDDYANDIKNAELSDSELIPDEEEEPETVKKPPLYSIDEPWVSDEDPEEGWDDFGEDSGEEDEDAEEEEEQEEDLSSNKSKQPKSAQQQQQSPFNDLVNRQPNTGGSFNVNKLFPNPVDEWRKYGTPVNKKGGNVNKGKFVKSIVRGLHKAAEGVEQQANESSILDTPIKGREAHINNFRRGIKNLGNEFYAKQIYDQTQELNNQVRSLPPMAQDGMQVESQDLENPMHHLQAYAGSVGNIFRQPMNQIHGAGYENLPEARKGREQRQAERQQRNMGKDFRRMFGDMAVGYAGVPGMPNYIQMITPQIQTGQGAPQGSSTQGTQGSTGPGIDFEYKKGPWWTGRREWSAKGIPAEMMMGMIGGGGGGRPGAYYGPGRTTSSSSWNTSWSSPGEIIREKVKTVNSKADPAKNNTTNLNNNSLVEDQRKKHQEYIDDYNNETVTDPIGAGMSRQAPISFEEFIAKDADGLSEYDYWLKRSPGTTTSSKQLNPNSSYSKTSSSNASGDQVNALGFPISYSDFANAPNPDIARAEYNWDMDHDPNPFDQDLNPYVKKSGQIDDPSTKYNEDAIWSSPYDKNLFHNLRSAFVAAGYDESKFTPEELAIIRGSSYITTDPEGNEYSSYDPYGNPYPGSDISNPYGTYNKYLETLENMPWDPNGEYYDKSGKKIKSKADYIQSISDSGIDINSINWVDDRHQLLFPKQQFGGPIAGASPDEYGNLQKFIYGGDEDIPISPIVAYDNNDIQSKNVDDPFMFRNGGLYKFAGPGDSQVNSSNSGIKADSPAPGWTWDEWNALPEATRNKFSQTLETQRNQSQTQTRTQTRTQTQGGYNPQNYGYGYPTAPSPMRQIFDMFNPIKKDFTWLSQRDYPRTADGQIYNPQGQGQGQVQGQTQNQGQGQGTTTQDQTQGQTQGQTNPAKAGYMYDYKYEKGPWWSGKKTLTVSGKWVDPNNPNAGAAQPGSGNTQNNVSTNTTTNNATANNTPEGWKGYPYALPGTQSQTTNTATQDQSKSSSTTPGQSSSTTPTQQGAFPPGDPRGEYMKSQLTLPPKAPAPPEPMPAGFPANTSGPRLTEEDQMAYGGYVPNYMAYGGYMPSYQGGGTNAGSGPFDPNVSGIAGGGIGPCTEQQVLNAVPGDPCYNEGYSKGQGTPQDFSVQYDINDAKTLDLKATSRLKNLAGFGLRANAGRKEMNYNKDYLADNTTSDNRESANELDYAGGYSGLNQRIMSKSGAGATGFNRVVGEAAFVKRGGELKYQKGGVYDLTQEEIGQILAAGGQIKFIK
jgi:hypothetical protein